MCVLLFSLFLTASLAYTSLERPDVHRRVISKLDHALQSVGAPPTALGGQLRE